MGLNKILRRCWMLVVGGEIVISLFDHALDLVEKVSHLFG